MHHIKESIQTFMIENLSFLAPEAVVVLISALPILELRLGLPSGAILGIPFLSSYIFSLIGNLLPIAPILLLFRPVSSWLLRFKVYDSFYQWLYNRTINKSNQVEKYGAVGLILFTALPLPTTGAYSACLAAVLFFIPFKLAFLSISAGVIIASVLVSLVAYPLF
ncbi:COG2426 family protein [Halobacillus yeomjeoni]|uniref:COG2426 family protein n=1 Tax=Halobacillus yeomjeoni TaxID=311194 RepID=UPI001CD4212A|nr:COG2426 family protein [Halobacillus yeomjeoni]MCA0983671.1 COG2426 family protein [Halobacillus yeomjeoni]